MLTEKQLKIFGIFGKNIFKEITFKELKDLCGEKSNSVIQNAIKKFLKENLITVKKVGTSKLYLINYKNDKAFLYLELYNTSYLSKEVTNSIIEVKKALNKENFFYSLVIFGSYADNSNNKKSDLDIAVFISSKSQKTKAEIALNSASNKTILNLDYHIILVEEFKEMLFSEHDNLGKEIARKNFPIFNASNFYRITISVLRNDFNYLY